MVTFIEFECRKCSTKISAEEGYYESSVCFECYEDMMEAIDD